MECNPTESPCLFNVKEDPCEMINLASTRPLILTIMEESLMKHKITAMPPSNIPNDKKANPKLWKNTWVNWQDSNPMEFLVLEADNEFENLQSLLIAIAGIILGLAIVGIFTVAALRCTEKFKPQKKAFTNSREFKKVQTSDSMVLEMTPNDSNNEKNPENSKKSRDLSTLKNIARSLE